MSVISINIKQVKVNLCKYICVFQLETVRYKKVYLLQSIVYMFVNYLKHLFLVERV